jgi:hypothetical protein
METSLHTNYNFLIITKKRPKSILPLGLLLPGDVLLSQGENPQLPSALRSLTSVFGMGTGVTFSLSPPDYLIFEVIPSKLDYEVKERMSNHYCPAPTP